MCVQKINWCGAIRWLLSIYNAPLNLSKSNERILIQVNNFNGTSLFAPDSLY